MCESIAWNDIAMWGRTGSRTSRSLQFSSANLGITRETDLPACTIFIVRSNIRWNGKTWQKIWGETSGSAATSSKSSSGSNSFENFTLLLGVFGVFGVTDPISVIKNWMWSDSCIVGFGSALLLLFSIAPFSSWWWVKSLLVVKNVAVECETKAEEIGEFRPNTSGEKRKWMKKGTWKQQFLRDKKQAFNLYWIYLAFRFDMECLLHPIPFRKCQFWENV